MRLYLIRHGETDYNRKDLFRGRADLPLNDVGRAQAVRLGEYFRGIGIDAVYASPLKRAMHTASSIAKATEKEVVPLREFVDIDYGEFTGRSVEDVRDQFPEAFHLWKNEAEKAVFPKGESIAEVSERLRKGLELLLSRHEGNTVLLTGHKVINRITICEALGFGASCLWRFDQSNAAVNLIEWIDGFSVLRFHNATNHLSSDCVSPDQKS